MKSYNFRNRVLISLTKSEIKALSKDLPMDITKLTELISKVLHNTHKSTIQEIDIWIDQNVPLIKREFFIPTEIRDNIKKNLRSSFVKGNSFRIKLGTFLTPDLIIPLNEDEKSPSYHFMERLIDYACERTHYHLENNIANFCSDENCIKKIAKSLTIICIKN